MPKVWSNIAFLVTGALLAVSLSGCNSSSNSSAGSFPNVGTLSVCAAEVMTGGKAANGTPAVADAQSSTNVPLDTQVVLTFNTKIDAYSAYPDNFDIFTEDQSGVPLKVSPSTKFVAATQANCPKATIDAQGVPDPNTMVSQIKLTPGTYLAPDQKYIVLWRDSPPQSAKVKNPQVSGVQDLNGNRLAAGATFFTTGSDFTKFARNHLDVISMAPGKVFTSPSSTSASTSLADTIGTYISVSATSPIRIVFSEPVRQQIVDADPNNLSTEIPPTPIQNFPGMGIAVIDASTDVSGLLSQAKTAATNPTAFSQFLNNSLYRQLQGNVYTTHGRQVLNFELSTNCADLTQCSYPDNSDINNITQAVVVFLTGFVGLETHKTLNNGIAVGGFVHFSGFQFPTVPGLSNLFNPLGAPN